MSEAQKWWGEEHSHQPQASRFPAADHRLVALSVPVEPHLVEELLLERGSVVSYEIIRRWVRKFGPVYAKQPGNGGRRTRTVTFLTGPF